MSCLCKLVVSKMYSQYCGETKDEAERERIIPEIPEGQLELEEISHWKDTIRVYKQVIRNLGKNYIRWLILLF